MPLGIWSVLKWSVTTAADIDLDIESVSIRCRSQSKLKLIT